MPVAYFENCHCHLAGDTGTQFFDDLAIYQKFENASVRLLVLAH
jgi:hypothetical protein